MKLSAVLADSGILIPDGLGDLDIVSIEDDSREIKRGSLFIAVRGYETDGHQYIDRALENGALAVVTEREMTGDNRLLLNPLGDNRKLLSFTLARFYDFPWKELLTVGITGTNGKTSTVRMLGWILQDQGIACGLIGTVGHMAGGKELKASTTTPGALETTRLMALMRERGDKCCIMEVSSHALSQSRVDSIRYDVGLFTNISQDHLDYHDSMEEYLECKMHLFDLLKGEGSAIVGSYNPGYPEVQGAVTFGTDVSDDYFISEIEARLTKISFAMECGGQSIPVSMNVPGRFNVYNAAGALAAADRLGFDLNAAAESLSRFPGVPGRFQAVDRGQDFLVAVDYAHTPDALERVLRQAADLTENRILTVFGAGGDRDRRKRPIMGSIVTGLSSITYVTSDNPRTEDPHSIIADILEGIPEELMGSVRVESDRHEAIRSAISDARSGDVVIIAGKGHEDYQILGTKRIHFDDREEAAEALLEVMGQ